jgi:two-component sensor histidine kinase
VKDNGKGLPERAWKSGGTSFGKQLVSALCRQLRAQQTVSSSNGTEFNITIPLAA